jgi:pimeloyl-ACP methyl ester carboxylesterase
MCEAWLQEVSTHSSGIASCLASYTPPNDDWLLNLIEVIAKRDLAVPVKPNDILKHRRAMCSQQSIVFMELLRRFNIEFGAEQGLYRDGSAFADLAHTLSRSSHLYLFGDGLGTAVALRPATRRDVTGTATLGAFDRFASFAPAAVRSFYDDAFDNLAVIRVAKTPVLILHGRKDQVVPFAAA